MTIEFKKLKFSNEDSAMSFAKKVNGTVEDLRNIKGAKSKFSVTFKVVNKLSGLSECNKDFGYPNEFWQ